MMKAGSIFALMITGALLCVLSAADEHAQHDYVDFEPNVLDMTCTNDKHTYPFNEQLRGVNLGGWLVLEPWITPSLFYQFLGKDEGETAMDIHGFCEVLGPVEANRQLRAHWAKWLTQAHIEALAATGVNSLRLPIGDWMYEPYGAYVGCTDGALDQVEWLLDQAHAVGLNVLLDIHGVHGSQNGFDNSGKSARVEWTSNGATQPLDIATFSHWSIREAKWVGDFDAKTGQYTSINHENINKTLRVIGLIADRYKDHPAVLGIEPVNEPWRFTPIKLLKRFYFDGYLEVKKRAPQWKYVMHDSFRFTADVWGGFMRGCPDIALDTHIYQAWQNPGNPQSFYLDACAAKKSILEIERSFGPVIVGEWSLATDNCAMWLNGFNDNLPGFPKMPCKFIPCPKPYVEDQAGAPPDPTKALQPPYGTGVSGPSFGLCPTDIDWKDLSSFSDGDVQQTGGAACTLSDENYNNEITMQLTRKKLHAWSEVSHGFYMWNFRSELAPRWDYLKAHANGWFPLTMQNLNHEVAEACDKEDQGLFLCQAKRGIFESTIIAGMNYCCGYDPDCEGLTDGLTGPDLLKAADKLFNNYWSSHRTLGTTCDFGGAAEIVDLPKGNATDTDDGSGPAIEASMKPIRTVTATTASLVAIVFIIAIFVFIAVKNKTVQKRRTSMIQVKSEINFGSTNSSALGMTAPHYSTGRLNECEKSTSTVGAYQGGLAYTRVNV